MRPVGRLLGLGIVSSLSATYTTNACNEDTTTMAQKHEVSRQVTRANKRTQAKVRGYTESHREFIADQGPSYVPHPKPAGKDYPRQSLRQSMRYLAQA